MIDDYENTINTFNQNFINIVNINCECIQNRTQLTERLSKMKEKHSSINKNNNKPIFLFCLDSFLYQYKIFALEFENINKLWILHNNRMYSDYYKLYNIIVKYMKDDANYCMNDVSLPQFPAYKELEQTKEYDINDIYKIHESILGLIKQICISIKKKNDEINNYNLNCKAGFSISNYINTLNYEKLITESQTTLYINYMSFFHISQKKHLTTLNKDILKIIEEIDLNSNVDRMFSMDDILTEIKNENTIITVESSFNIIVETADISTNTIIELVDGSTNINILKSTQYNNTLSPKSTSQPLTQTLFLTQFSNNNV